MVCKTEVDISFYVYSCALNKKKIFYNYISSSSLVFLFTDIKFWLQSSLKLFSALKSLKQAFSSLAPSELMIYIFIRNMVIMFEDLIMSFYCYSIDHPLPHIIYKKFYYMHIDTPRSVSNFLTSPSFFCCY